MTRSSAPVSASRFSMRLPAGWPSATSRVTTTLTPWRASDAAMSVPCGRSDRRALGSALDRQDLDLVGGHQERQRVEGRAGGLARAVPRHERAADGGHLLLDIGHDQDGAPAVEQQVLGAPEPAGARHRIPAAAARSGRCCARTGRVRSCRRSPSRRHDAIHRRSRPSPPGRGRRPRCPLRDRRSARQSPSSPTG